MRSHLLRVSEGKAHHAIDTECAEFNSRFLVFIYVDKSGDPVSVKLLDTWRQDQPCQKTNVNAGTGAVIADCGNGTPGKAPSTAAPQSKSCTHPSEPEAVAVTAMRCRVAARRGDAVDMEMIRAYDTLAARLKRAEELLRDVNVFRARLVLDGIGIDVADNIHEFLAGKGEA